MAKFEGNLTSPKVLNTLFSEFSVVPLKKLGQNFLVDENRLQAIANSVELDKDTPCLEIGPGAGTLTTELSKRAEKVVAIELDKGLIPLLAHTLGELNNVNVIHGDFLKQDLKEIAKQEFNDTPFAVAANLPYNISTPAIMMLLESGLPISHMVFLMQKEVGERMSASPGGKDYGALTVAVQYACDVEILFSVGPNCFYPKPKVDSAVISLKPREKPQVEVSDKRSFFALVKSLFAMRRKTILNNLLSYKSDMSKEDIISAIERAGINPSDRAETLSIHHMANLFNELNI